MFDTLGFKLTALERTRPEGVQDARRDVGLLILAVRAAQDHAPVALDGFK